jgi:mannose-6-phosphate isomerase-like protein (cupin superfamily)
MPLAGTHPACRRTYDPCSSNASAIKALGYDDGDFVVVEWTTEVGTHWIAPMHLHHRDDEAWIVLERSSASSFDGVPLEAPSGSAVLAPRGTPHTHRNARAVEARYLLVTTPKISRLIEALLHPGGRNCSPDGARCLPSVPPQRRKTAD